MELFSHRLGSADDAADRGFVQNGPVLGRIVDSQALLPCQPYRDLALDLISAAGRRGGMQERAVVIAI